MPPYTHSAPIDARESPSCGVRGTGAAIMRLIAAPMVGAMARDTKLVKKETLAKIVSDVAGMGRGYDEVKLLKLKKFHTMSSQRGG